MDASDAKTMAVYSNAADHYDDPANAYWQYFGRQTVARLGLQSGDHVLDAACGTGASALSAARMVGEQGHVTGIDLSDEMLALASCKARRQGLKNIEFRQGNMREENAIQGLYDAVVCVFGIFFIEDMERMVAELWQHVRPGGCLAVTTWGEALFEPMYSVFDRAVADIRPELVTDYRPWDRLVNPSDLEHLLSTCSEHVSVVSESHDQTLSQPESWWRVVLGSGRRSTVLQLSTHEAEQVRVNNLTYVRDHEVDRIVTKVNYGVAQKPMVSPYE